MDIAGQERFHSIQNNYYNQVDGILFIYDITNENIFNIIEEWLKEVKKNENKILQELFNSKNFRDKIQIRIIIQ